MTIYLIGFMGSGKSYTAAALAEHLGRPYIDLDAVIEREEGRSISDIFAHDGEEIFRDLETKYLHTLTDPELIVATGGGAPCFNDNLEWMNDWGITVFLDPSLDILVQRLTDARDHRPLLQEESELRDIITEKLKSRRPIYEQASLHLAYDDPHTPVVSRLAEYLENRTRDTEVPSKDRCST